MAAFQRRASRVIDWVGKVRSGSDPSLVHSQGGSLLGKSSRRWRPRLEDFRESNPDHSLEIVCRPTRAQEGFLTGNSGLITTISARRSDTLVWHNLRP
jgi:hypothetical protein